MLMYIIKYDMIFSSYPLSLYDNMMEEQLKSSV